MKEGTKFKLIFPDGRDRYPDFTIPLNHAPREVTNKESLLSGKRTFTLNASALSNDKPIEKVITTEGTFYMKRKGKFYFKVNGSQMRVTPDEIPDALNKLKRGDIVKIRLVLA